MYCITKNITEVIEWVLACINVILYFAETAAVAQTRYTGAQNWQLWEFLIYGIYLFNARAPAWLPGLPCERANNFRRYQR